MHYAFVFNGYLMICRKVKKKTPWRGRHGVLFYGAGHEIRTRDFNLGKVALYH